MNQSVDHASDGSNPHTLVLKAFERLDPSGMLACAILDQKAEKFVSTALVHALNHDRRIAEAEYRRLDLVLWNDWEQRELTKPAGAYQAKCQYLSDFEKEDLRLDPPPMNANGDRPAKDRFWWLGGQLRWDLETTAWPDGSRPAGLFYLLEVEDPRRQSKYSRPSNELNAEEAMSVVQRYARLRSHQLTSSTWSQPTSGTRVRVHLGLFEIRSDFW